MIPLLQLVVSNILVATLIAALAWQVGRSGRRAKLAHVLWVIFFVKLITPPIVLLPIAVPETWLPEQWTQTTSPYQAISQRLAIFSANTAAPVTETTTDQLPIVSNHAEATTVASSSWSSLTWICSIWLLGCLFVVVRGLTRFVRFHRLLHREGRLDEEATAYVRQLLTQESNSSDAVRGPNVLRLPVRVSPMLFGFGRRAVIVCPDQLWQSLSTDNRNGFLAHETAHYYRRDHWVRWLEWIVTAAYWWLPLVYIGRRQLERHEEACCDAWAVSRLQLPPRSYAEALLRVVDFISEHDVGIPRLASGMQPTDTLEERLRLVMKPSSTQTPGSIRSLVGVVCFSLWLIHPIAMPTTLVASVDVIEQTVLADPILASQPIVTPELIPELGIPEVPLGFWNQRPPRQWAEFSLTLPNARLIADAEEGITIRFAGQEPLQFTSKEMSAIAEVPATQRLIVGDRAGQIRLWDLSAGMPVSLIGRHADAVTSLAYHKAGGLVSADDGGSVIQWDIQSGQALATWSSKNEASLLSSAFKPVAIQSVRFSEDGSTIAILTGGWNDFDSRARVHFVQSQTLEPISSIAVQSGTAVVLQSSEHGWVAVDWAGKVRTLGSNVAVATLDKHQVSALVFSNLAGQMPAEVAVN